MRVRKSIRKNATLLMLCHRKIKHQSGEAESSSVTAYTVARWHSIPQSNAWLILDELVKSRFVKRHVNPGKSVIITYSLNRHGQKYVDKRIIECIAAQTLVFDWKLAKYKRSLST
jgi:hypothetical protein